MCFMVTSQKGLKVPSLKKVVGTGSFPLPPFGGWKEDFFPQICPDKGRNFFFWSEDLPFLTRNFIIVSNTPRLFLFPQSFEKHLNSVSVSKPNFSRTSKQDVRNMFLN